MRAFIAIVPDPPALDFLRRCHALVLRMPWSREVRWVDEPGWHVTVRFLGEVSAAQADRARSHVAAGVPGVSAFDTALTEPRFFPSPNRPRIVASMVEDTPELQRLFRVCDAAAADIGCEPERRGFHGHITHGRCRDGFPRGAPMGIPGATARMRVRELVLFMSELTPRGAIHTALDRFALGQRGPPAHSA